MAFERTEGGGVRLVIRGEPASKANSRQIVLIGGKPRSIKSKKARDYVAAAKRQLPHLDPMLSGRLKATLHIFYASERPDLDESLILDVMQDRIYANDRQVRERHVYHAVDQGNPRAEIEIEPAEPEMALPAPAIAF